ncbi:MAG TPA: thiamine phosphate synthase [Pyrinomonadaceae bacterium]|nr:thiamine phosphate synthase [Pyrinomonadaceae bacterium]
MSRKLLQRPTTYLITSGQTTHDTTPASEEFLSLLALIRAAVAARVTLVQLREKLLRPRVLYELTERAARLTEGSATSLLVNDRADIARAAGASGVHLTTQSLDAAVVRQTFGKDFLVGVSTHTLAEATAARDGGADFAVFGPVFDTPAKRATGLGQLRAAAHALAPFPLLALGGITLENARDALRAGAHGIAAIRLFADAQNLSQVVRAFDSTET